MNLPQLTPLLITLAFGVTLIIFSIKEEKSRVQLTSQKRKEKNKHYEIETLKEIQDSIGYSLNIEKIIEVIIATLPNLFTYSTVSYLLKKNNGLSIKIIAQENVSSDYIQLLRKSMLASYEELTNAPLPSQNDIEETLLGVQLSNNNKGKMASYFHIPFMIGDTVVGVITIASTKPKFYSDDEMTILYQVTHQAAHSLSQLHDLMTKEKERLMAMITSLPDGVIMLNQYKHLLVINEAAKSLLGINKENPTTPMVLSGLKNANNIIGIIESALLKRTSVAEEFTFNDKTIHVTVNPVIDEKLNVVIGASIVLHDMTQEKALIQAREDFTNMVVHELRAPLTVIKDAAHLIENQGIHLDKEEQLKLLHMIHDQSKRLLEDIGTVLDAGKLTAGKLSVEKTQIDITKLINDRVQVFIPQAQTKKVTIVTNIQQGLPSIFADPLRIDQVLNNLLSNSFKFTQSGGSITLSAFHNNVDDFITVSVKDTGMGIPKEKQKTLFMKYSQVLPQVSKDGKTEASHGPVSRPTGTGLGLYITKGIIEEHDGTISLDSTPGAGTTITFTLPINSPNKVTK